MDVYLARNNEKKEVHSRYTKSLDDRELSELRYIGGHVLKKLNYKIRNSKNYDTFESQEGFSILEAKKIFR